MTQIEDREAELEDIKRSIDNSQRRIHQPGFTQKAADLAHVT